MSAPLQMEYATPLPPRPARPIAIIGIACTAIFAGALVGTVTNAVNGAVSPTYFVRVMGWWDVSDVWWASVKQGVMEGSVVGFLFSIILTITIGIVTRFSCTYQMGLRWLGYITLVIFGMWILGGGCGVWLASAQPAFFRRVCIGVPEEHAEMVRYAWVGGSIDGAELGGILVVIVGLVLFWRSWRRMLKRQAEGTNS